MTDYQPTILEFGVQVFTLNSYNRYESTILMRIIKHCQKDISEAITSQRNSNQIVFRPNENSVQMRHVKIHLGELEPDKTHYSRLIQSLESMAEKSIQVPYFSAPRALQYMVFPQLFTVSFVMEHRKRYAILHVTLEVLRYYLSNAMGFHRIDLNKYFAFSHFATQQVYRFHEAYLSRKTPKLTPQFISQAFSLNANYNSYASVAKNILEPARKEMKQAYDANTFDMYFRYKALYDDSDPNSSNDVWADKVLFTFVHRDDAHPQGEKLEELTTVQMRTKAVLKIRWGMDDGVAESLSRRVKYPMIAELSEFFLRINQKVEKRRGYGAEIRNPAGYMRTSLNKFLTEKEEELGIETMEKSAIEAKHISAMKAVEKSAIEAKEKDMSK